MRPDARMRLESVSKLWTATLILRLAQQHRLSLDDTVERWLPGLLPAGHRITVRQLLNHTSGLIDNNDINQHPTLLPRPDQGSALRAKIAAIHKRAAKDPGYEFSPRLWVEFAAALPLLLATRHRLPLLQHRLHRRGPRRRTSRQAAPPDAVPHPDHRAAPSDLRSVRPALEDHRRPRTRLPGRRERQAHRHDDVDTSASAPTAASSPTRRRGAAS